MAVIGPRLAEYHQVLLSHQQAIHPQTDSTEQKLIEELVSSLEIAGKKNESDWNISYQQLRKVKYSSCPLSDPHHAALVVETIEPYCESLLAERKALAQAVLEFVHDFKTIKHKSHLMVEKYHPDILPYLKHLFNSEEPLVLVGKMPFETIVAQMKASKAFSETDLGNWLRRKMFKDDKLLKDMRLSEKVVPRKYFPAGEYKIDPLLIERYNRYKIYNADKVSQVEKEAQTLLHLPNLACESDKKSEIQLDIQSLNITGQRRFGILNLHTQ